MKKTNTSAKRAPVKTVKNNERKIEPTSFCRCMKEAVETDNKPDRFDLLRRKAFAYLADFFQEEVSDCEPLFDYPSEVIDSICNAVFATALTGGEFQPEMPEGFDEAKDLIQKAFERAKSLTFAFFFEEEYHCFNPENESMKLVSAMLNIRDRKEAHCRKCQDKKCPGCGYNNPDKLRACVA